MIFYGNKINYLLAKQRLLFGVEIESSVVGVFRVLLIFHLSTMTTLF